MRRYREAVDRESAAEKLAAQEAEAGATEEPPARRPELGTLDKVLRSPVARSVAVTVAGAITRGILGALRGSRRRGW